MTRFDGKWLIEQAKQGKKFVSYGGNVSKTSKNKYGNIKTGGNDSKKENKRSWELKLLEKTGKIRCLKEQVPILLHMSFKDENGKTIRSQSYKADFEYYDNEKERWILEDVKGFKTRVYLNKIKLLKLKIQEGKYDRNYLFIET